MPIACVHIPRFSIETERQRRPELTARLILIGEDRVFDCSLGAEASGVRAGSRMSAAIGLCHKALVLPPDLAHYEHRFEEVLDFLESFSPEVEPATSINSSHGLGLAYLSLNGLSQDRHDLAETLIAGLHKHSAFIASVGIAGGKFPARVAALTSRPGLVKSVPSNEEAAFLAPLAVEHLPVEEAVLWRFKLLGLKTMGDVAALPSNAFQAQFGAEGKRYWELASGIDQKPLLPRLKEKPVARRLQFPARAVDLEAILAGFERVVHAAYTSDDCRGRWVRKALLRADLEAGGTWEIAVPFREALTSPMDAWFAIRSAIERHPPERPVEELEVELVGLGSESGKQAIMFESGRAKLRRQVDEAVRQVRAHHGRSSIGKVVEVEPWSRIPERRSALLEFDP